MLKPADIFSTGMILQRENPVSVWGTADPGDRITVQVQGKKAEAKADGSGKWLAVLPPLIASVSETMEITDGVEKVVIDNMAVGEVWLAGGQSNMEYQMYYDAEKQKEMEREPDLYIRQFTVPEISWEGEEKKYDFSRFGSWRNCGGEDLEYFSAVGYYFARKLRESTDVPIGIVNCSCGGTRACCWMTEEAILASGGEPWLTDYAEALAGVDIQAESQTYRENPANAYTDPFHDAENSRVLYPGLSREQQEKMLAEGLPEGVIGASHPWRPAGVFYTMLRKVTPYSVRGVLFYQGESDAPHADLYERMLTGLIRLWRKEWGADLPFLLVQLAPFERWIVESGEHYPELRRAQERVSQKIPGVWLASSGDAGMHWDIHPKQKRKIGERLALLAEKHVYGEDILCDAPHVCDAYQTDSGIILSFTNTTGLSVKGERINALQLIASGSPLPEESYRTELSGNTVRIRLSEAREVSEIRFAQTPYYEINLYNEAGIPALPFQITEIRKKEEKGK